VLFYFTILAFATACWYVFTAPLTERILEANEICRCAGAPNFNSFFAARILNGFFATVAQGGGLMFIKDIFFFHEHARAINVWDAFIILSPYFGPFVTAFVISKLLWRWAFWIYSIMSGLCVLAIIFVVDETYYDRRISIEDQPPRGTRLQRLLGIAQVVMR
jgi:MFS family permease